MTMRSCFLLLFAALLVSPATARCEERTDQLLPSPITLEGAVNYALAHQPILRAQGAQDEAAEANLSLAHAQLIPRGDIGLQENRATGNVVPGAHFSMAGIPPVSGPPNRRVFDSGVWGSTAGLSVVGHRAPHAADGASRRGVGRQSRFSSWPTMQQSFQWLSPELTHLL